MLKFLVQQLKHRVAIVPKEVTKMDQAIQRIAKMQQAALLRTDYLE